MAAARDKSWGWSTLQILTVFALFSFLFHFAWEILQAPLFARMPVMTHWQATLICLQATFGDVAIALASFAAGAGWNRTWKWYESPGQQALIAYLATGLALTIAFEWHAVRTGRWSYSELMPVAPLLRVGAVPLLQWIVIPLAVLYFLRRHDFRNAAEGD